jgi:hypothetical protein
MPKLAVAVVVLEQLVVTELLELVVPVGPERRQAFPALALLTLAAVVEVRERPQVVPQAPEALAVVVLAALLVLALLQVLKIQVAAVAVAAG